MTREPRKWTDEEREAALEYSETQDLVVSEDAKRIIRIAFLYGVLFAKGRQETQKNENELSTQTNDKIDEPR